MRKALFLGLALVLSAFVVPLFVATPGTAASYTIKVTSPATGAQVSSLGVQMVVQVGGGFILDQQNYGGTNITDHGHVHYFVDGVYKGATWLTEFVFTGLTPGGAHPQGRTALQRSRARRAHRRGLDTGDRRHPVDEDPGTDKRVKRQ